MPTLKDKAKIRTAKAKAPRAHADRFAGIENRAAQSRETFHGKQARTGNSRGFRFESTLFRSHPEFNGEVEAHVIAPGRMLVVAANAPAPSSDEDPVFAAFMSFLASDMERRPDQLVELDSARIEEASRLVTGVESDEDEDLGEALI